MVGKYIEFAILDSVTNFQDLIYTEDSEFVFFDSGFYGIMH